MARKKGTRNNHKGRSPDWLKRRCQDIVDRYDLITFLGRVARGSKVEYSMVTNEEGERVRIQSPACIKDRLRASELLLDRGWGKPAQSVELSGQIDASDDANLSALIDKRMAEIAKRK